MEAIKLSSNGRKPRTVPKAVSPEAALKSYAQEFGPDDVVGSIERLRAKSPTTIAPDPGGQMKQYFNAILRPDRFYSFVACIGSEIGWPSETYPVGDLCSDETVEALTEFRGVLIRPNSVVEVGSGYMGNVRDADIVDHDYLLLESDAVPLDYQAATILKMIEGGLPIRSAVHSGGKSIHVLLQVNASDKAEFRARSRRIYRSLVPLGFDPVVGNPSRMTRVPGCDRTLPDGRETKQTLLYLA